MCDGHGIAHPRRLGIATHLGILTDRPTLGCGKFSEPTLERGARTPLMHKNECIGTVLRTKDKVKPVFVSLGHKMDLATAEELVFF